MIRSWIYTYSFLFFVLMNLGTTEASASGISCQSVFAPERNPFFYSLYMLQQTPGSTKELAAYGSQPVRNPGQMSYRNTMGWQAPEMLRGIRPPNGVETQLTTVNVKEFYDLVYGQYSVRHAGDLLKLAHTLDNGLEMDRLTYYKVVSADGVEGTFRLFTSHANAMNYNKDTFVDLPFERLNKARGVAPIKVSETLREYAQQGHGITEIGKFWVRHESTAEVRDRTSHLLELYWAAWAKAHPDDIMVAHVMSKAHVRLYRRYGFKLVEEYTVPGGDGPEAILTVTGREFSEALQDILNVDLNRLY